MDNSLCLRTLYAVSVNMAHYVVTNLLFLGLGNLVVYILGMSLKLCNLLVGNIQAELLFTLRKSNPKLSPSLKLEIGRENVFHFLA